MRGCVFSRRGHPPLVWGPGGGALGGGCEALPPTHEAQPTSTTNHAKYSPIKFDSELENSLDIELDYTEEQPEEETRRPLNEERRVEAQAQSAGRGPRDDPKFRPTVVQVDPLMMTSYIALNFEQAHGQEKYSMRFFSI